MDIPATGLRWIASSSTSALHAANELRLGRPLVDAAWDARLREPAALLARQIDSYGDFSDNLWRHLVGLSAGVESNRQLAEVAVRKTYGAGAAARVEALAGAIAEVELAARDVQPQLADELLLRSRPLREQWEARGPGLLRRMSELVDPQLLPAAADVILVHPVSGGRGVAHLLYNSVRLEAVLANPLTELPEILRLAWLVAQLNQDLPMYSEQVPAARLHGIARLALLPVTLLAAEHVELAASDEATLTCACRAWAESREANALAELLTDWWHTYLESRPPWRVALQGLDRLLGDSDPASLQAV